MSTLVADPGLDSALHFVAAGAAQRDADPRFPHDALEALAAAGAPGLGPGRPAFTDELSAVRAVSRADASVGRIYDGHLNALERLDVHADPALREAELAAVARGELWLGVWGADPAPGEGPPARVRDGVIDGVKVFCSGAGGLQRALVLARDEHGAGPPQLAYVELRDDSVEVDRDWFRGAGMRSSESHRVVFHATPVLAVLGAPGVLSAEPWFSRDAVRTSATWLGTAQAAAAAALALLAERPADRPGTELDALAAGRILAARRTAEVWLEAAGRAAQGEGPLPAAAASVSAREALRGACATILDEATRACGARALAGGGPLDRARRDLELFLLQKRLDPLVARMGAEALQLRRERRDAP